MTTHAMIDLETLGTGPDCVVLTIGGVKFNPNEVSNTYQEFYYRFDVDEQLAKGRTTLQSTLDWWARQDKSVRDEALGDENSKKTTPKSIKNYPNIKKRYPKK